MLLSWQGAILEIQLKVYETENSLKFNWTIKPKNQLNRKPI